MSGLKTSVGVPPLILLEADLRHWLHEDLGRGDGSSSASRHPEASWHL